MKFSDYGIVTQLHNNLQLTYIVIGKGSSKARQPLLNNPYYNMKLVS